MKRDDQISAFILCGGASSRMGREKASLMFGGETLLSRTIRIVEPLVGSVAVVGNHRQAAALGIKAIEDLNFSDGVEKGKTQGPLAGIATALAASQTEWNLILACDLPYLTSEWLDWFLARALQSPAQVIMPRTSGGMEPLAACYRRECGKPITDSLIRGVRKITDALEQFRIEFIFEREWQPIDPDNRVLRNMNSPADYEEAVAWLEKHPS